MPQVSAGGGAPASPKQGKPKRCVQMLRLSRMLCDAGATGIRATPGPSLGPSADERAHLALPGELRDTVELVGASRNSTGFGAMEEGLMTS